MSTKACSVAFVALLLLSRSLATPSSEQPFSDDRLGEQGMFQGSW